MCGVLFSRHTPPMTLNGYVLRRTHQKLRAACDLAELSDDELVPEKGIVEQDIARFKLIGRFFVVVIGIIPDDHVGRPDNVFDKARRAEFVGKGVVGGGDFSGVCHGLKALLFAADAVALDIDRDG